MKLMRRILAMLAAVAVIGCCVAFWKDHVHASPASGSESSALQVARGAAYIPSKAPGVSVGAQAAALIDVSTGRILYQKNANARLPIASLTKVITAITAIQNARLTDTVTVGPDAVGKEGSSIYLRLGEKLTLEQLLYGIMLRSGNDAATAIADHVGGSVPKFAAMMNSEMQKLGLTSSHFVNPHGLDNPDHYSTAHDLAVVTAYALHDPNFATIVKTQYKRIPWPEQGDRVMKNKNKMLVMYEGADGVKTGYTKKAGRCLIASATRNGRQLAVVVINDPSDWADCSRLLDYGFTDFPMTAIVKPASVVASTTVPNARENPTVDGVATTGVTYPLYHGELQMVQRSVAWRRNLKAPLQSNETVGKVTLTLSGHVIGETSLVAAKDTEARGFWAAVGRLMRGIWSSGEKSP